MQPKRFQKPKRPEKKIEGDICTFLAARGWYNFVTHGGRFQSGFPDIFTTHAVHGSRLIEVKLPGMKGSSFTKAQLRKFPLFISHGSPIWILTAATEYEYRKLFQLKEGNYIHELMMKRGGVWAGSQPEPKVKPVADKPEKRIEDALCVFLRARGWYCFVTHGGMYQSGFPDIYATHPEHGVRLIEVKLPDLRGSRFTNAQLEKFPLFNNNGSPIWVLTDASEYEYRKLFDMPEGNFINLLLWKN